MDKYAQSAYLTVTESAANTLTFSELNIASEVTNKKAMVINRIEYQIATATLALVAAAGDVFIFGLSLSDNITAVTLDMVEVFDRSQIAFDTLVTSGAKGPPIYPVDKRFNDMPGGGLLVPVKKLYAFAQGVSLGGAGTVSVKVWYQIVDLKTEDYLQLVEAFQILK